MFLLLKLLHFIYQIVPFKCLIFLTVLQLFRRVAAALPGMDSTPEKSKEDSILFELLLRRNCCHTFCHATVLKIFVT